MKKFKGLTSDEVRDRIKNDQTNDVPDRSSRSVRQILYGNIFTRFNALLAILMLVVILIEHSPRNALFFFIAVVNSGIGIFQELRAKRVLDKLAILAAPLVTVIRDGRNHEIAVKDVVQDDLIRLRLGDQIVADGEVLDSSELEIDESLLTGESDPVVKATSDQVLSGSIVVAGSGVMRADKVGAESYSSKLTLAAKKFQRAASELLISTNRLLKWISWMLLIVAPILVVGQLRVDGGDWRMAIIHSVAAIVGMIPEGLVLLTSAAFFLAAIYLARRKVLVQQMPSVETLARVDTLLLDKTGTLTEGNIRFEAVILEEGCDSETPDCHSELVEESMNHGQDPSAALGMTNDNSMINQILSTIARRAKSPTNDAIASALKKIKPTEFSREIPFSSARKWSAIEIDNTKFIFGAPEVVLADPAYQKYLKKVKKIAREGKRVLVLVKADKWPEEKKAFPNLAPLATVVLSEKIRSDAAETLQFFAKQNVDIKIISGDSPLTVAAVAKEVGLQNVKEFDARNLPNAKKAPKKFSKIVREHNVFGRVQPEQKRQIAAALQKQKHVVAMTGDGVNDALALKKADLGIAMNSGASATKAVAEVVLLDNKFSHLPSVLSEGRRVIANIERVANLFIIKNVYSLVLALGVTVLGLTYPYLPIQMTVISALSIGIPAFFLALAPNQQIYRPGFLKRVLRFAIPVGIIAAVAMMANYYLIHRSGMSSAVAGTSVSITLMMIALTVLILFARPVRGWKLGLILSSGLTFAAFILIPSLAVQFRYELDISTLPTTFIIGGIGMLLVIFVKRIDDWLALRAKS
ncbi:HAD-IC family P-type ATPase [Candidatus Saccharibacteria bacterium]|nr:HAD-IC family P-type ATPase [Candidatus Saccharibacteria bacterium]